MLSDLLGFAKHIGRKIINTDAEAADNILKHIQSDNPGVDTLRVAFDDGVVTLNGRAFDQASKEKVVLMAGNIEGVESVDAVGITVLQTAAPASAAPAAPASAAPAAPASAAPAAPASAAPAAPASAAPAAPAAAPAAGAAPAPGESQFYEIESGDTLYAIASKFYGNGMKYTALFEANRGVIEHPDRIYPGQKIRIPDLG